MKRPAQSNLRTSTAKLVAMTALTLPIVAAWTPLRGQPGNSDGPPYTVNEIVVMGDEEALTSQDSWSTTRANLLGTTVEDADLDALEQTLAQPIQDRGFLFATVRANREVLDEDEVLILDVSLGRMGDVNVTGNKYVRSARIRELLGWEPNRPFNYGELYARMYEVNLRPDVEIDAELNPVETEDGDRIVDVDISVRDRFPIFVSAEVSNTGLQETGDWRARLTVQTRDLIVDEDNLFIQGITNPEDVNEAYSFSAGYTVPLTDWLRAGVYGGYSESEVENVLTNLDILGTGKFVGGALTLIAYEDRDRQIEASIGYTYLDTENIVRIGATKTPAGDIELGIPRFSLSYADKGPDPLGGRTYLTNTVYYVGESFLGSSGPVELGSEDFVINRLQVARHQPLTRHLDAWSVFLRTDWQIADADDTLPSPLQLGLGGASTVRGYEESEIRYGDSLLVSAEMRSPDLLNGFGGSDKPPLDGPYDSRLQLIAFADYGTIFADSAEEDTLLGVGLGLRASLTRHLQTRVDVAYPLEETEDSDGLRTHLSVQAQY